MPSPGTGPNANTVPPLTQLEQMAAMMHEVFMAFVEAGFTRDEALKIVMMNLAQMNEQLKDE